jgi:hypothetical protein
MPKNPNDIPTGAFDKNEEMPPSLTRAMQENLGKLIENLTPEVDERILLVAKLKLDGLSDLKCAKMLGMTRPKFEQLRLTKSWLDAVLLAMQTRGVSAVETAMITLTDVAKNSSNDAARVSASRELLDRYAGAVPLDMNQHTQVVVIESFGDDDYGGGNRPEAENNQ